MSDERYPARRLNFRSRDFKATRVPIPFPMGVADWFLDSKAGIIGHLNKLIHDLEKCKEYSSKWFNRKSERDLPVPIVIKLRDRALAKSHRPDFLIKEANAMLISIHGLGKLIISVYEDTIDLLIDKLTDLIDDVPETPKEWVYEVQTVSGARSVVLDEYKEIYELLHELTGIEAIYPYSTSEVLAKFSDKNKSIAKNDGEIKVRFFNHNDSVLNSMYLTEFNEQMREVGIRTNRIRKLNYVNSIISFAIPFTNEKTIEVLSEFPNVESIDCFTRFQVKNNILSPSDDKVTVVNPIEGKEYPKLAIVDSGISEGNLHLKPWIDEQFSVVIKENQDNYHGEFVAGMMVYGHLLNSSLENIVDSGVKILDIVAIPDDEKEQIREDDLLQTLEDALEKHSKNYKVWNISLGTEDICDGTISEFTATIDSLQDKYNVIFVISSGNYDSLRTNWPIDNPLLENDIDRITTPADSMRGITVGGIALDYSTNTLVEKNDILAYSRRGPGVGLSIKPDLVHYSGNPEDKPIFSISNSETVGDFGTSFSAPLVSAMLAEVYHLIPNEISTTTAKALIVHGARHPISNKLVNGKDYFYFGFGLPRRIHNVLYGNENEITLIYEGVIDAANQRNWVEIGDFPFPSSLYDGEKIRGEILLTLCYNPPLSPQYGSEYCRGNLDIRLIDNGTNERISKGPSISDLTDYERWEKTQMTKMLKWSTIKQEVFNKPRGGKGTSNIRLEIFPTWRELTEKTSMPFSVIVTIRDPKGNAPIYNDVVQKLNQSFISEEVHLTHLPVRLQYKADN